MPFSGHGKQKHTQMRFIFSHPDYTVGMGITPIQLALADCTAGRELHPALKIVIHIILHMYYKLSFV